MLGMAPTQQTGIVITDRVWMFIDIGSFTFTTQHGVLSRFRLQWRSADEKLLERLPDRY